MGKKMPLPDRYRKIIDDFYAGRLNGNDLRNAVLRIDSAQKSFEFKKGGNYVDVSHRFVVGRSGRIFHSCILDSSKRV